MKVKNIKYSITALLIGTAITLVGCDKQNMNQEPNNRDILEETTMSREEKLKDKEIMIDEIFMFEDIIPEESTEINGLGLEDLSKLPKYKEVDIEKIMNAKIINIEPEIKEKKYIHTK